MKTQNIVLLSILLTLLAACSSSYDAPIVPEPEIPSGPIELGVLISMGDAADDGYGTMSRSGYAAPATGDYEPGAGYENYIDIAAGDFALYIFSLDNKLISRADITALLPAAPGTLQSSKKYMCRFRLDNPKLVINSDTRLAAFKLVMLANWQAWPLADSSWGNYPVLSADSHIDDLYADIAATRTYAGPIGPAITAETRIPLFGVGSYSGITLSSSPDNPTQLLESMHLLRAFAKIEVRPAEESSVAIETVTLTRANALFKTLPSAVYDRDGYITGWPTDYVSHVSVPDNAGVLADLLFPKVTDRDCWVIYVPEYDNLTDPDLKSQIKVTYKDGNSFLVDFKNYGSLSGLANDEGFNIRRNNWYVYELNRVSQYVNVELDVQPYALCEVEAGLGLLTDELGDLKVYMEKNPDGSLKLPDTFQAYLDTYGKTLPTFTYHDELGDYYAIHRTGDGTMKSAEIWLKDRDGAQVLSDFSAQDANDQNCSTREVREYITLTDFYNYYKDKDGDRRMQHNTDHSSLIYRAKDGLLFKTYIGEAPNKVTVYYEVESWDEKEGTFYIRTTDKNIFIQYGKDGKPKKKINIETGVEEEIVEDEDTEQQ